MPSKFCTQCGSSLSGESRFCGNCGSTVEETMPGTAAAEAKGGFFARLKSGFQDAAGAREEEKQCVGVPSQVLDVLAAYSFMNTPLDTQFLLVENEQHQWRKWIPIAFLESMQGLKPMACGLVGSVLHELESICLEDRLRSCVTSEASEAYGQMSAKLIVGISCYPYFDARNNPELEMARGKWAPLVKESRHAPATIVPLPVSGLTMKQRLLEHEQWILSVIQSCDSGTQEYLKNMLGRLRAEVKQMPDRYPDHAELLAWSIVNGEFVDTVLLEEEESRKAPPVAFGIRGIHESASPKSPRTINPARARILAGSSVPAISKIFGNAAL